MLDLPTILSPMKFLLLRQSKRKKKLTEKDSLSQIIIPQVQLWNTEQGLPILEFSSGNYCPPQELLI